MDAAYPILRPGQNEAGACAAAEFLTMSLGQAFSRIIISTA